MLYMNRVLVIGIIVVLVFVGLFLVKGIFSSNEVESNFAILEMESPPDSGFRRADGSYPWKFPDDFGPHPDFQTEWWYYTGNLKSEDGRRFGYQLTFFRRGLSPSEKLIERESEWGGNQVYMGHFAISDIGDNTHYSFEKFSRAAPGLAGSQSSPFRVWLENWEVSQISDDEWWMVVAQEGVEIELKLKDEKGVIFHGDAGYSQKGIARGNASYYFSQTRLKSSGSLVIAGTEFEVTGLSWMDHEFSTSALSEGQVGWDWFSIQLNNEMELMLFQIRRSDGSIDQFSSGTLIKPDGETIHIDRIQFEIDVLDFWRSPHSDAVYPASWKIGIPHIGLTLDVQPYMDDQEMNVSYAYWEGAVSVTGELGEQALSGSGYVEMTGYAMSMEGEF